MPIDLQIVPTSLVEPGLARVGSINKAGTAHVGAGLLAKGPSYSTYLLNDTPLSRASPLPQGFVFATGIEDIGGS
ncbi:hypothetical protein C1894_19790 [Pseudomonas sp. FW305-3-2-15-E-TSA2]|nr:hypothetical protein C1894_19790 [Pseudomonas sp. FW305-3-2-15-E-TSA2]